jgi:hypothetical protein
MPQEAPAPPAPTPPVSPPPENLVAAMQAMRNAASRQLEQLTEQREQLLVQIGESRSATEQASLARRLESIDARMIEAEQQVAGLEMEVARLGAEAGTLVMPSQPSAWSDGPPTELLIAIPAMLTVFVLFPLTVAYARRIWNRGRPVGELQLPAEVTARLERVEAGVDSIAIEIERISEGQRFVTKLLAGEGRREAISASSEKPR